VPCLHLQTAWPLLKAQKPALAMPFYYFKNDTAQDMVLKVPNPLGVSRSVPVSKASKIQVAANDFAFV